jgi:hypothetical protein
MICAVLTMKMKEPSSSGIRWLEAGPTTMIELLSPKTQWAFV